MSSDPENYAELVNQHLGGFNTAIGLRFSHVTEALVQGELAVTEALLQPYGLVHGGVYAAMIEAACSTGAAISAGKHGMTAVGLENSTSFLRAARAGTLTVRATPSLVGRRTQVWTADVTGDDGRVAATGRVRVILLEAGAKAGGQDVALK